MNTRLKCWLMPAVLALSGLSAVHAEDIQFTGRVVDESCQVDTASSTGGLTVPLGDVPVSDVKSSGGKSPDTPFNIVLTGCPTNDAQISLSFTGTPNGTNASLLQTAVGSGTTAASGVGIAIFDANGGTTSTTPMNISTNEKSRTVSTDTSGSATFSFIANIMNDGSADVVAGDANATATINVNYE